MQDRSKRGLTVYVVAVDDVVTSREIKIRMGLSELVLLLARTATRLMNYEQNKQHINLVRVFKLFVQLEPFKYFMHVGVCE